MSNVTVTVNQANITVDEANSNVAVTTTTSNVVVAELAIISNAVIRAAISVTDTGGDGSLSYDNTNGVFTYTGPSASEVRSHFSATAPVEYSSSTGVISIDSGAIFTGKTTDDLAEGTTNKYWSTSGAAVTTTALPEGTNLYYTQARFDSAFTAKSTTDLSEGTNLYYTSDRANSNVTQHYADGVTSNIVTTGDLSVTNITANGDISNQNAGNLDISANTGAGTDEKGNIYFGAVKDTFNSGANLSVEEGNAQITIGSPTEFPGGQLGWYFTTDSGTDQHIRLQRKRATTASGGSDIWAHYSTGFFSGPGVQFLESEDTGSDAFGLRIGNTTINTAGPNAITKSTTIGFKSDLITDSNLYVGYGANSSLTHGVYVNGFVNAAEGITAGANIDGNNITATGSVSGATGDFDEFEGDGNFTGDAINLNSDGSNTSDAYLTNVRSTGNNTYIRWHNASNSWQFNDGNATYDFVKVTNSGTVTSVAGGTNINITGNASSVPTVNLDANISLDSVVATTSVTTDRLEANIITGQTTSSLMLIGEASQNPYSFGTYSGDIRAVTKGNIFIGGGTTGGYSVGADKLYLNSANGVFISNIAGGTNPDNNYALSNVKIESNVDIDGALTTTSNITSTANVSSASFTTTGNATVGANLNVLGNLEVTGNINYREVEDLLVRDQTITLNFGNASANDVQIISDRSGSGDANTDIKWNETADKWTFTNDGSTYYNIATSTSDVAEGTNLYYTDARAQAALSTTTATPSANGALAYDNGSGVFTFTPADVPDTTDELTEGTTNLYYTDARVQTKVANLTGDVTTTANVSGANVNTDHVISASGQPLQLKGQTDGIELDKTISSTETSIVDIDTTGYAVTGGDITGETVTGENVPGILLNLSTAGITSGSNTFDVNALYFNARAMTGVQSGATTFTTRFYSDGNAVAFAFPTSLEASLNSGNMYFFNGAGFTLAGTNNPNLEGYKVLGFTNSPTGLNGIFPASAYVTGVSGNTVTMSETATTTVDGSGGQVLLRGLPIVTSSTQPGVQYYLKGNTSSFSIPFTGLEPVGQFYENSQTLSNTTLDIVGYTDTSVTLSNATLRHIADLDVGPDSAIRINRALLIGANATPDVYSGGETLSSEASILGITLENDGLTSFGSANATPQTKFLINQYTDNSVSALTELPNWATDYASGFLTEDLMNLGGPNFNFKVLNGNKDDRSNLSVVADTVVGKLTWNAVTGSLSGSDLIYPPSALTVKVNGSHTTGNAVIGLDTYIQSTYETSYQNGVDTTLGGIPRTFLASKNGDTVIAAKTDGGVQLRPVRDYGDTATSSSFVQNRFPEELHEYHTYLNAGFKDTSAKTGTLIEIQPKSGSTNASTADFNYDSKGDSTLRLTTHEANSAIKQAWEITNEQASGNLIISDNTSGTPVNVVHFDGVRVQFDEVVKFQNLDTTAINALPSPEAGDTVFNTTLNQLCFYNGTAWQKITSATM